MKKYLNLTALAAIAAALAINTSCSSSEDITDVGQQIHEPMVLGVGMNNLGVTRAVGAWTGDITIDQKWSNGIKVQLRTSDGTSGEVNKLYVTSSTTTFDETGGGGTTDVNNSGDATETTVPVTTLVANGAGANDKFYWNSGTETKTIKAWTYGTTDTPADYSAAASFTVSNDQTDTQSSEFLYAYQDIQHKATVGAQDHLIFVHQLALVEVTITTTKNVEPALTMGEYKAKGGEGADQNDNVSTNLIPITATFTPPVASRKVTYGTPNADDAIGTWSALTPYSNEASAEVKAQYSYITPNKKTAISGSSTTWTTVYQAVMIPGTYVGMPMFVIDYDGARYIYTGKAAATADPGPAYPGDVLAANTKYEYNITISNQGISVNATIKPWTDATGSFGGDATLQ